MKKPYIGITGFMSYDEVMFVLRQLHDVSCRLIMVGVLASLKTLRGLPNKWPNRYPAVLKIFDIFSIHDLALNLIHYDTKEPETLREQLVEMTRLAGGNLHGFQLNIAWPSLAILQEYRREYPDKKFVLQVGGHAFEMVGHSPDRLAGKVSEYEGVADYVLLDPSGGYGKPFNPERARDYLFALKAKHLSMGLGVAGGLSPSTLDLVEPLVKDFPDLSIDAEGRLRTKDDHLDLEVATEYVCKALTMFRGAR